MLAEKIAVYETMLMPGSASATWGLASRNPSSIRSSRTFKATPYKYPSIVRTRSY